MFYEPGKTAHGLPRDPFKSCVIPRPIGWISTLSRDGVSNLAPFSQFQNLTFDPPFVMFASNRNTRGLKKDSVVNAEETGEFVWNMATYELREAVNLSAQELPPEVDEFEVARVTKLASIKVKPYRVAESPIHFECLYHQTVHLSGNGLMGSVDVVFGRVVGIHIKDEALLANGKVDVLKIKPIARLGYHDYTVIDSIFEMTIPAGNSELLRGMEGKTSRET